MKIELEKLSKRLIKVKGTYPEFVRGVIDDCEHFKDKNPNITEQVLEYVKNNPNATPSDIIDYTSDCSGLPWADENDVWHRWDTIITEEEARRITQTEYFDD